MTVLDNLNPDVRFPPNPAFVEVKGCNGEEVEHVSMRTLLEVQVPSLFKEFRPLWWLNNGHLQTLYSVANTFSQQDFMTYHRTYLRLADGGTLGLDFAPYDQTQVKDDAPIVVVHHGLAGGSHDHYIREILTGACSPVEEGGLGYRAVVVNFRGCAGVPITSPKFYSAGSTDDAREALMYLRYKYPYAPLLGLGFSLGANFLTRYLGEEGTQSRLQAGCVLACPWDLNRNGKSLVDSFLGKNFYSKAMGSSLKMLLNKHFEALTRDPDHSVAKAAHKASNLWMPTLDQFDDAFTIIAGGSAPPFPFSNVSDFYHWVSSHKMLDNIRVPFLSINAKDDPVVKHVPMRDSDNGLITMVLTPNGGHLGWFQAGSRHVSRWTTKPVLEWLRLTGENVVHKSSSASPAIFVDAEGFLREEGRPSLGCKVLREEFANNRGPTMSNASYTYGLSSFKSYFYTAY